MRSPNAPYSERLDHIRFFAAFTVLSYHAFHPIYNLLSKPGASYHAHANPLSVFIMEGQTAVGLFLTLSGFLFARICLKDNVDFRLFYANRALRICPLLISAIFVSMCVGQPANLEALVTSLLTLQFLPTALKGMFVDHLWSIGVEVQFYILFPVLLLAYRKIGMKYLFQVIALGLLLLTCVQLTAGAVRELSYLTIFGRLNQAVIGMIFGFTFDRYRRYLFSPIALFASLSIASSSLLWLHAAGGHQGTADSPLWIFWPSVEAFIWATVICTYQACSIKIPSLLSRLIAHLGAMSYSIYVVHYFFICALCAPFANLILSPHHRYQILEHAQNWLVKHPLETSLLSGIFVILPPVLVLSFFTFNVIERPFMRLRKKYILPCESPPPASDIEPGQYELAYQR